MTCQTADAIDLIFSLGGLTLAIVSVSLACWSLGALSAMKKK